MSTAFVNPQRACAARVTVLGLCVCLSVSLMPYFSDMVSSHVDGRYQWLRRDTAQIIIRRDFTIDALFKSCSVICLPVAFYEGTAASFRALF